MISDILKPLETTTSPACKSSNHNFFEKRNFAISKERNQLRKLSLSFQKQNLSTESNATIAVDIIIHSRNRIKI